jgi:hypothetical protein
MSISLYEISIPALVAGLTNLNGILDKAIAHAATKKFDSNALAESRLIADMHPLTRQIQMACDSAKGAAARLAGVDVPKHEDSEATLPELKTRIAKTLDFLKSIKAEHLRDGESREITLAFPQMTLKFTGLSYVTTFVLPNFYFHVSIAYALLRQNAVEIGKRDYLGAIQ